ncbi:raffinose/stachyose/melibiose transport system substrate-binding protein [Kineococcus xinjiangensis]|uniref:Raffinose/stachyose/melibiose transport system substrate-binding protein n=1 Tax=Kineococcus xinjiangensis TaxID=512762 RepID=A0A2S6IX49_9ACTN|nr:extracellular solute-binding protein [Kineococcus xinjiangensis]PPK98855.1 raffinose/stachyose/melibiose transport system substrate-binding protein [Kineococcus xinjiangensis]
MAGQVRRGRSRTAPLVAALGVSALALTACGGGDSETSGGAAGGAGSFDFLVNTENATVPAMLETLSQAECKTADDAAPLKIETVPQKQLDQKLQLLAGQNALPEQFAAGSSPALTKQLAENGHVVDFEKALTDLGKLDKVQPAAIATIESLYGGFNALPYEYNVEGIWYNKKIFADNGIAVPTTWDELVAASEKLQAAGVQPFAASGEQGWPITRMISGYLFRSLGPDAMDEVAAGEAKLTDPEYVAAAQAVADLGAKGWFGQGVGSIDYDTAMAQFLGGETGMMYMGSWALGNFTDPEQNQIGVENVGFMPFPAVAGGKGSIDQLPSNVGLPMTMSEKAYDENAGAWLGCIADNYGSALLEEKQSISGFVADSDAPVDDLTKMVQDKIASTDETVLWFEAHFPTKATDTSQTNAAPLVSGTLSAQEFMELVQTDLDAR